MEIDKEAEEKHRTDWIEANYIVSGWWIEERQIEEFPVLEKLWLQNKQSISLLKKCKQR